MLLRTCLLTILAGFPYWHFPSLVDSLERTFQCIVINHFAAKTSWTPRPHIWLPHAVDIPLCVPGKWPWVEWCWGKNSRAAEFEAVRVRERNVKVESVELYVKWWAWLEFPSCWNSTSTYFYPAALTWHMSSSSAIHVLKYRRILWFFFSVLLLVALLSSSSGRFKWRKLLERMPGVTLNIAYTPHCSALSAA